MEKHDVIIVGGGTAGAQAAISLRQRKFGGSVMIIGKEHRAPYQRPPLSKDYLAGEKSFDKIYIRPPGFWSERDVALRLGASVITVDPRNKEITLSDGTSARYKKLIWAAGGRPHLPPFAGSAQGGVHSIRNHTDAEHIAGAIENGAKKIVIIGGGYIGLEVASVLRKLGCEVCIIETLPRILTRVAGSTISEFYRRVHQSRGVEFRLTKQADEILRRSGTVTGIKLNDGEVIPAEMIIVGIGINPVVEPLKVAGAKVGNGVVVDEFCRTSLPDIFAIGDCAAHPNRFADGQMVRLESVQNANEMAIVAAAKICGGNEPYEVLPWFWSTQYDLRLQTAGLHTGHDTTVIRGNQDSGSFSVVYLKNGVFIAIDCVNSVKDFAQSRKLIEARATIEPSVLANTEIPLKEMLPCVGNEASA